jgi:site-specific recombinase XerC
MKEANYDIRTIQELPGHSDARTAMIYTHTIIPLFINTFRNMELRYMWL